MKARIQTILAGIDRCEVEDQDGWWETTTGAKFGSEKLAEVVAEADKATALIDRLEGVVKELERGTDDGSCPYCYHDAPGFERHKDDCPALLALIAVNEWREEK